MKKTGYVTSGAILAALAVVVMLVSHFPFLTYSLPAIASLFIMVAVIELGPKWAVGSYVAAAVLTGLFAEKEAAALFILIFGYYPIIKVFVEKIKSKILRYTIKLILFNAVLVLIYLVLLGVLGIESDFVGLSGYLIYGMWVAANVVFLLYDRLIVQLSGLYIVRLHDRVSRYIKK